MSSPLSSENSQNDESTSQEAFTIEAEHPSESMKPNLFEKPDIVKRICIREVRDPDRENKESPYPLDLDPEALEKFQKVRVQQIEKPGFGLISMRKPFAPFVYETLKVPSNIGFNYGANMYNTKHNMIICCPSNSTVHFYDADDLIPMKQRKVRQLNSSVVQMSYCEATNTHLMGCYFGEIYAYNAALDRLDKIFQEGDSFILAITHLDENNFAFSSSKSKKLFFGNLESRQTVQKNSNDSDVWYLHHIPTKRILLAGLANGKIAVYNSRERYSMIGCFQAHKFGKYVTMISSIKIKGKEYIITAGNDKTIKIWHIMKGRLRLLKVIQSNDSVSTFVYLENYQMIASTHHQDYVKFFKLPHGKLEATVNLRMEKARNIFLMKDKNIIGVANLTRNVIKMVQLHPAENSHQNEADE